SSCNNPWNARHCESVCGCRQARVRLRKRMRLSKPFALSVARASERSRNARASFDFALRRYAQNERNASGARETKKGQCMNAWRTMLLVVTLAVVAACSNRSAVRSDAPELAIVGVTVVNPERDVADATVTDATVVIRGDRIAAVGPRASTPV